MVRPKPTLHLLCGKIASGKSTLAAKLARRDDAIVLSEDEWLSSLFGDQMKTGADFLRFSDRLRNTMAPHIVTLLERDLTVVLDFAANTVDQRAWMHVLVTQTQADHQLHVLDVPDDVCLARLESRNKEGKHAFAATEAQFRRFTKNFVLPTPDEGFTIMRH
jgi:predicted kinase